MKKIAILAGSIVLALLFSACGNAPAGASKPSPTPGSSALLPEGGAENKAGESGGEDTPDAEEPRKNTLYDPSIFVIEASGTWRQELAPGYYADYECELYLDKFDANDNRSASGLYTGVFWMSAEIDASEYIEDMLGDAPIELEFDAGGEVICDNLTMHLQDGYQRDPFGNYDIPDGQGGVKTPGKEALAGEGSFVTVTKSVYLEAHARGAAGERVDYQDPGTASSESDISYVIQIEPDPTFAATELRATIQLSDSQGMSVTIEGVWRRLPGYSDDLLEYANSGKQNEVLNRHMD